MPGFGTPVPGAAGLNPAFQTPAPAFQEHFPLMVDLGPQHGGSGHPQTPQYLPEPGTIRPIAKAKLLTIAGAGLVAALLLIVVNELQYGPTGVAASGCYSYVTAALAAIAFVGAVMSVVRTDRPLPGIVAAWAGIGTGVMTAAQYFQEANGYAYFSSSALVLIAVVAVLLVASIVALSSARGPARVQQRGRWRLLLTGLLAVLFLATTAGVTWSLTVLTSLLPALAAATVLLAGIAVAPVVVPAFDPGGRLGRVAHLALTASALSAVLLLSWTYVVHGPGLRVHAGSLTRNALNWGTPAVAALLLAATVACALSLRSGPVTPRPPTGAPMY